MLLGLGLIIILLTVQLLGGRVTALAEVRFRRTRIIFAAIAAQIVIISVIPGGNGPLHQAVHLGSYCLAGWFVWENRSIPGLVVAGLGGLSNFAAISANGGVMPALPSALRTAGLQQTADQFANSTAVHGARLQPLGDVFAIPASWPAANVYSVGDVLILLGIAYSLHRISGSRALRWLRRPVAVDSFVALPGGGRHTLLRLTARPVPGERVEALWAEDGKGDRLRHAVLPGPEAAPTVGFAVPSGLLVHGRFALETTFGGLHPVPAPAPDPARRPNIRPVASRTTAATPIKPAQGSPPSSHRKANA